MASNMNSKLRLVRCPRCRKVLPEPPGVPVYECGGCDAKLQAKKRENSTADTTSQRLEDDSLGKRKMDQVFGDQEAGSSSNSQSLINSINDPEQNSDHNDLRSSNKDQGAAKEVGYVKVKAPSGCAEEYSYGTQKTKQLSDDPEVCSSLEQQSLVNSIDEPDQNIDHNDPRSSTELSGNEDPQSSPEATAHNIIDQEHEQDQEQQEDQNQDHYQDEAKKQENVTVDATSIELEHSLGKQKIEQLSDHHETGCSSNQQLLVNSINELDRHNDHNERCSSSELSYDEDPHNRIDHDHDHEFLSCRNNEFEESSSEFEEANTKIIRDSDGGSSFKSLIAEKLLDTRQKKGAHLDEEDILSEDGSADLFHPHRFERISSAEVMENVQLGGTNYYGYEGSVSSFDGNDNLHPRKNRIGSIGHEYDVDSGNRYRFNRRNEFHPLNGRLRKDEHRSTDVRSFYSLNEFHENSKHRAPTIPENPKLERIELLKMVRELQDQLERTNISNPQQVPSCYNHILNKPGRYGQRMAFSGEATAMNRRRDCSSCHHCCPQDRHFSAHLPNQHVCYNGQHYGMGTYYSPRCSGPSSPKHYSESEFSAPDDHRHRNEVMKPYRSPKKKRYVRPVAGGSPWITCYRCSELLQLPQSFLVFKKRYHSLRCGACMRVLNFTLSNGTHVSRYYPEETIAAPPSSEVEDYDKSNGSRAGPVSCSDRSFQKSYSTETDRNGSRELSEERRKAAMSRDPSGSTRPSSSKMLVRRKATSEIEEVGLGPNGSPLHWLMGYASPSKVIRG